MILICMLARKSNNRVSDISKNEVIIGPWFNN
jgi:hypothetical protein